MPRRTATNNSVHLVPENMSDISTWADHEYELQRTYGNDKVQFSEYLKTLRQEVLEETEEKIFTAVYAQMNSYK